MKTEVTKRLEMAIWKATNKHGVFGCFEVTIGWRGHERVDYMTYDTKGDFRCYEIKVTKADFHSPCQKSFVGHLNYYVMPEELYNEVKNEIPGDIGVWAMQKFGLSIVKRARRRSVNHSDMLKDCMIRSLCREVTKQIQSESPLVVDDLNREIARLKKEYTRCKEKYTDLLQEVDSGDRA